VPNDLVGPLISPHSGTPIEWDARTDVGSLHVGAPTGGGGSEVLHVSEVVFVPALPNAALTNPPMPAPLRCVDNEEPTSHPLSL